VNKELISHTREHSPASRAMDNDADMMAMMGISGFGARKSRPELDATRFDKTKRTASIPRPSTQTTTQQPGPSNPRPISPHKSSASESSDEEGEGDGGLKQGAHSTKPDFDEDEEDEDEDEDEENRPEFPISHELVLSEHTKVLSAIALDPSGARVLSGSHDYECKLWDFGGMDARGKPFKSWEPSGSYYVSFLQFSHTSLTFALIWLDQRSQVFQQGRQISGHLRHLSSQTL
jgi:WD repeat-containing protein 70